MQLILGSKSPRRREILGFFSYPFEQISPRFVEEDFPFSGDPIAYAQRLSEGKAHSLASLYPGHVILTADTCVYKEGRLFEKPADEEEAFAMLSELNGSWHTVYTAVTTQCDKQFSTQCGITKVLFHPLPLEDLKRYHKAFNGLDKAGGYGIQNGGSIIVKQIEGCFYNVMGLPLSILNQLLRERGIDLWNYLA